MKLKQFEAILSSIGFALVRANAHRIWTDGKKTVAVPHGREVPRDMARRILKQAGCPKKVPELNYG